MYICSAAAVYFLHVDSFGISNVCLHDQMCIGSYTPRLIKRNVHVNTHRKSKH